MYIYLFLFTGNNAIVDVLAEYGYQTLSTDISRGEEQDFETIPRPEGNFILVVNPPFKIRLLRIVIKKHLEWEVPCYVLYSAPQWYLHRPKNMDDLFMQINYHQLSLPCDTEFQMGENAKPAMVKADWFFLDHSKTPNQNSVSFLSWDEYNHVINPSSDKTADDNVSACLAAMEL